MHVSDVTDSRIGYRDGAGHPRAVEINGNPHGVGRKPGEAAGVRTGVEVFADSGRRWISGLSGPPTLA